MEEKAEAGKTASRQLGEGSIWQNKLPTQHEGKKFLAMTSLRNCAVFTPKLSNLSNIRPYFYVKKENLSNYVPESP